MTEDVAAHEVFLSRREAATSVLLCRRRKEPPEIVLRSAVLSAEIVVPLGAG
jgi:hypothetical protein